MFFNFSPLSSETILVKTVSDPYLIDYYSPNHKYKMAKCLLCYILIHSGQITRKYTVRNLAPVGFMFDLLRLGVLFWPLHIKMRSKIERKET